MMILAKECWNKPQDRRVVMIYCCQIGGYSTFALLCGRSKHCSQLNCILSPPLDNFPDYDCVLY